MAIAVNGGHVSRALDFYNNRNSMYLAIGASGSSHPWEHEPTPDTPDPTDFKLKDIIALKKVDVSRLWLVIPSDEADTDITYRDQTWKRIVESVETTVGTGGVTLGSYTVILSTASTALYPNRKVRIANTYEGTIVSVSGLTLTLDTAAPVDIAAGAQVLGGAIVEGAKYVYVEASLEYDDFPVETYRQIGLMTHVVPAEGVTDVSILRSAAYSPTGTDEYSDLGILEVIDNRYPTTRDSSMRELISFIVEF